VRGEGKQRRERKREKKTKQALERQREIKKNIPKFKCNEVSFLIILVFVLHPPGLVWCL
jgi:hypothetical protein